jgi:4-hydroxy-3-polyprenylbenzoate decarboxylase
MPGIVFDDLQTFMDAAMEVDEWRLIEGADWNEEIGALTEAVAELIPDPPMLVFDHIKNYPAGFRVVSLPMTSAKRAALALGLDIDGKTKTQLREMAADKMRNVPTVPPVVVPTGPVMENVVTGDDIDLFKFPVPRFHAADGGRYIGTGDSIINKDPESDFINVGTYRIEVHEPNLLGIWMSPGQQGRQICQRYWDRGESCPVAAIFGGDLITFMVSSRPLPWGRSEFDHIGGLRGRPLEVVKGPITGLPIPAHAEIAIEGEIPPPSVEARPEGPFGEWPGYYSGGTLGTGENQPVIRVKAVYHRNNPVLNNSAPLWPGAPKYGLNYGPGKERLERAGIQDVVAVASPMPYIYVVSLRQRYPGHAKQAALAAASGLRLGLGRGGIQLLLKLLQLRRHFLEECLDVRLQRLLITQRFSASCPRRFRPITLRLHGPCAVSLTWLRGSLPSRRLLSRAVGSSALRGVLGLRGALSVRTPRGLIG